MADVNIDTSIGTATARGLRSVVFTTGIVPTAVAGDSVTATSGSGGLAQGGTGGSGENSQALSQSFTATESYNCSSIQLRLSKSGSPTDNLVLTVRTGSQTGSVVATSNNLAGSSLGLSFGWITLTFPSEFSVVSGTKYWLVLERSGARDTTNSYTWELNSGSLLANGGLATRSNNVWGSESGTQDLLFQMMANKSALVGYFFYIDSAGTFVYSKSTNGGVTWGAAVTINSATTHVAYDVWFDQWTPGDSGTLIHLWYFDTTNDIVRWRTLDTSSDTLGTERAAFTGASAVAGRGAFVSGTKTRSGYLYCAFDIDAGAEKGLVRSTDSGTTWSANLSTTFVGATLDQCLCFPASGTGDNNDMVSVYHIAASDDLQWRGWDSSVGAVTTPGSPMDANCIENTTDLTGQMGFAASIRHSDGAIFVAEFNDRDTTTTSLKVYRIDAGGGSGFGLAVALTSISVNVDDMFNPAVFIDQNTNAIYVAYNGNRSGSEVLGTTTKVYYTKSTNGGSSWTIGDTPYMEDAAAPVLQIWTPISGPLFYVGWREASTTLVGNAVNSVDVRVITGPVEGTGASTGVGAATGVSGATATVDASSTGNIGTATGAATAIWRVLAGATGVGTATGDGQAAVKNYVAADAISSPIKLVDSYSESNISNNFATGNGWDLAQVFSSNGGAITSAKFFIWQSGGAVGSVKAELWSITGTPGTNAVPSVLLATSDIINISAVGTGGSLIEFFFTGANQYVMSNGVSYAISVKSAVTSGQMIVSNDNTSPTHSGNFAINTGGGWSPNSGEDLPFYVYASGIIVAAVSGVVSGSVGAVTGTSTVAANSTRVLAADGAASGVGTPTANSAARWSEVGAASGTSTVNANSSAITRVTVSAAGLVTATANSAWFVGANAATSGAGAATANSARVIPANGASTGAGSGTASGEDAHTGVITSADGSATGAGTATGNASALVLSTASTSGTGAATGNAVKLFAATGATSGTSTATGNSTAFRLATGAATGTGTVTGNASRYVLGTGSASGLNVTSASAQTFALSTATVSGQGVATAISARLTTGVYSASGTTTVIASGTDAASTGADANVIATSTVTGISARYVSTNAATAGVSNVVSNSAWRAASACIATGTASVSGAGIDANSAATGSDGSALGSSVATGRSIATVTTTATSAGEGAAIGEAGAMIFMLATATSAGVSVAIAGAEGPPVIITDHADGFFELVAAA